MGCLILREPRFPPALSRTNLPKKCNALLIVVFIFLSSKMGVLNEKRCKSSNKLQSEVIGPRENAILHSCVGEWHMDTMF